ncbi:MAG: hypothetical protein AAGA77_04010 [Bacteroidota bacterium]
MKIEWNIFHNSDPKKSEQYYLKAINKGDIDSLYNLAVMYQEIGENEKSERYYLAAIKEGIVPALNNLALLYYYNNWNIEKAFEYSSKFIKKEVDDLRGAVVYNIIALAAAKTKEYLVKRNAIIILLTQARTNSLQVILLEFYLSNLLLHNQENWVLSLFESNPTGTYLKEFVLAYYFATVALINEGDTKIRAMPAELKETVDEIVKKIIKGIKKYYG